MMIINVNLIHLCMKMYIKVQSDFIAVNDFALKHRLMFDFVASGHSQIPIFFYITHFARS